MLDDVGHTALSILCFDLEALQEHVPYKSRSTVCTERTPITVYTRAEEGVCICIRRKSIPRLLTHIISQVLKPALK